MTRKSLRKTAPTSSDSSEDLKSGDSTMDLESNDPVFFIQVLSGKD